MRQVCTLVVLALVVLALVVGCRGGGTSKQEPVVAMKQRPPKPFDARRKVAVVDFVDKSHYGQGKMASGALDVLTTFLVKSQQFRVIEREKVDKVLEELKFQHSGAVDPATAKQIGKILGVDLIVYGVITNFGTHAEGTNVLVYQQKETIADATVDIRMINAETAEVLFVGEGRGTSNQEVRGSFGLGGSSGFDQTIPGKALRAAIAQTMDDLLDMAP